MSAAAPGQGTLARRIVRSARAWSPRDLPEPAAEKVKICLLDFFSCALESLDLSPSRQAIEIAARSRGGPASVIGAPFRSSAPQAAFANAVLGHGLVREDMHTGSVSHLGIVIFPTLLALSDSKNSTGRDFLRAAACGYEVGAAVGKAVMDAATVRMYRPTGITGPLGASVGGSILLGLEEDAGVAALGLAANSTSGLNEWPGPGADEMFFHAGFAARNAVTSVELAELGAYASETSLDGAAGLFASIQRADRVSQVALFAGEPEILSVYHKPVPACNYAQTASQAARLLAAEDGVRSGDVVAITVRASAAALNYPGCRGMGPFRRVLQGKMSIPYCVAAALVRGAIEEANYRMLADAEILRLIAATTLTEDPAFTKAYPRVQGGEVIVTLRDGRTLKRRLEDVIPATADQVRERFRSACTAVLGESRAGALEEMVQNLEYQPDMRALTNLLGTSH